MPNTSGLPLVGAQALLVGVPKFDRDSERVVKSVGLIRKSLTGIGKAGVTGGSLAVGAIQGISPVAAGVAALAGSATKALMGIGGTAVRTALGGLQMALGGVKSIVGATFKAIKSVTQGIIGMAAEGASIQNIERVFRNMTQAMDVDADALVEKMQQASRGAVDTFELMASANKSMVGAGGEFGKMFAESLPFLMKVSREAAKGSGESVKFMYDSIVMGIKRMSPQILDNLGFMFSMSEEQEKYAALLGISAKELSKEQKQMALLNAVMTNGEALIAATGGSMENWTYAGKAFGTMIRDLRKRIGIELTPLFERFSRAFGSIDWSGFEAQVLALARTLVQKALPAVDGLMGKFMEFKDAQLMPFLNNFSTIVPALFQKVFGSVGSMFTTVRGIFSSITFMVTNIPKRVKEWLQINEQLVASLSGLAKGVIGELPKAFRFIVRLIKTLPAVLSSVYAKAQNVGKVIADLVSRLMKAVGSGNLKIRFGEGLGTGIQSMVQSVMTVLTVLRDWAISTWWPGFVEAIAGAFSYILGWVTGTFWPWMLDAVSVAFSSVVTWISGTFWPKLVEVVIAAFNATIAWVTDTFWPWMLDAVSVAFSSVVTWIKGTFWPKFVEVVTTAFNTIITWIKGTFWPKFVEVVTTAFNLATTWVTETFWPKFVAAVTAAFDAAVLWVTETFWPSLVEKVSGAFDAVMAWVEENWPGLYTMVTNVLSDVGAWLEENWPGIMDRVTTSLDNIKSWVDDDWPGVRDKLVTGFAAIGEAVSQAGTDFNVGFAPYWENIVASFKEFTTIIGPELSALWLAFKDVIVILASAFGELDTSSGNVFTKLGEFFGFILREGVESVLWGIVAAVRSLTLGLQGVAQILEGDWKEGLRLLGESALVGMGGGGGVGRGGGNATIGQATGAGTTITNTENNEYNLNTTTDMQPGQMQQEFSAMQLAGN